MFLDDVKTATKTLVLVPTAREMESLDQLGGLPGELAVSAVCGFGVVSAAARSSQLLSALRPRRVLLVGIAGTFDEKVASIGSAVEFSTVVVDGIGAGEGEGFVGPQAMGFPQWPGVEASGAPSIFHRIDLASSGADAMLLTGCAASGDAAHAATRRQRFPEARAEDMEGFAVAMACALHSCPVRIVRGIANVAGDRDSSHWRILQALAAAREMAMKIIESGNEWESHR